MATINDSNKTLAQLHEERDAIRTECEIEIARKQIRTLKGIRESFGGTEEDWGAGGASSGTGYGMASDAGSIPTGGVRPMNRYRVQRSDRDEGRYPPFYESEEDILRMLAMVRNLATFDSIYLGAGEALNSYTMGGEWTWTAEALTDDCPPQLIEAVQKEIDNFIEVNEWVGELDSEIHDVTREDGDVVVGLYPVGSNIKCTYTQAEYLTEPQDTRKLDEWIDDDRRTQWFFGVHVAWCDVLRRWNREEPLGYHCVYDAMGKEWDYLPRWPNPQLNDDLRCGTHIKRNVGRGVLRGVSDYWSVYNDLEGNWKLHQGTRQGATLQSYIAYIVKYGTGATRESIDNNLDQDPLLRYDATRTNARAATRKRKKMVPGTIISTDADQEYQASPMGSLSSPVFIDVAQFGLRRLSVRWNMPEYLISGDASNSAYASTLSAGSPFVKARQKDQSFYRRNYRRVFVKMLYVRFVMGAFDMFVSTWADLCKLVDIQCEAPDVDIQNILELTQRRALLNERGILAADDWAALEELDPAKVTRPAGQPQPGQEMPAGEMSLLGRRQFSNNTKAIDDILNRLIGGEASEAKARALLGGLGLTQATVDALILDAKDGVVNNAMESLRVKLAKQLLWEDYP